MSKTFYICTAIAYVNGVPHMGHAMEFIEADAIARYKRLMGFDVRFSIGTDEYGVKLFNTAKEQGIAPQDLADKNSAIFRSLKEILSLSYDDFIRTTDQKRHWPACQKIWKKLRDAGDIYEKEYEGLYCEGCETFMAPHELVDGKCPNHKKAPTLVKEKNYF
ncbi:MAG: class I tRNA ligase family protein, partial [Candidatus Peregrinibacteria bacterium]